MPEFHIAHVPDGPGWFLLTVDNEQVGWVERLDVVKLIARAADALAAHDSAELEAAP